MKDWVIRSIKTFIQAFVPCIITDIAAIESGILSYGWDNWKAWLMPVLIPAVSAGICAVWNLILEKWNEGNNNGIQKQDS